MARKTIIFVFLLTISLIIIYLFSSTNESRIKRAIRESITAIEKEDLEGVMSKVSFKYQDDYGLSYILLKRLLDSEFKLLSGIEIEYENLKINIINDKQATALLDVRVIAGIGEDRGYYLGDIKEPLHLRISFEKGPMKKWLVIKVSGINLHRL